MTLTVKITWDEDLGMYVAAAKLGGTRGLSVTECGNTRTEAAENAIYALESEELGPSAMWEEECEDT